MADEAPAENAAAAEGVGTNDVCTTPTTTKAFTLLRPIVERCFIAKACLMERHEVIINMVATKINDVRSWI